MTLRPGAIAPGARMGLARASEKLNASLTDIHLTAFDARDVVARQADRELQQLRLMLRAACPQLNEIGAIDVIRDLQPSSLVVALILAARLISATERVVQLPPLSPEDLGSSLIATAIIAEKLHNDAAFNDLVAMGAAGLDMTPASMGQLEFKVLSILAVHEGTLVFEEEYGRMRELILRSPWKDWGPVECIHMLRVRVLFGCTTCRWPAPQPRATPVPSQA